MLPKFYNYNEEGKCDDGYEALQDFFLSWTLRCAATKNATGDSVTVRDYSRRMIYFIIHGIFEPEEYICSPTPDDFEVISVRTRRQEARIDLIAEVDTLENGESKQYILSIENKWYTGVRQNQLKIYNEYVRRKYAMKGVIIQLVIACDNCRKYLQLEKEYCRENDYKFLTIDDMSDYAGTKEKLTGNALFDAYWAKQ